MRDDAMTERQWCGEVDFDLFLAACEWLGEQKKNHRKLRLWACACCRRLGDLLADGRSQDAVAVAERLADGLAGKEEVREAREEAKRVPRIRQKLRGAPAEWAASASVFLLHPSAAEFSQTATIRAAVALEEGGGTTRDAEQRLQFELLRDIFGNPFRPVTFDPSWRTATAVALAQQVYDSRDYALMPILADALEEAGCDHANLLAHCRGSGPHARGCWVIDAVLGRA
jgi:hypothetical protein